MGRPRPSTNASGGHGGASPNPPGYPAPPPYPPPPAGTHDVAPLPQHETEPPAEHHHPPPAPYDNHHPDVQVPRQYYHHEGAATEETQPPAPYPPQEPYAPPAAAAGAADVPHYPPESGAAPGAQPARYPPPPPLYPPPPVMGTPVPFPPPGPQRVTVPQSKDDAGGAALAYAAGAGEQWSSELFDCDMSQDYAIATAICPCVTFGQIAEIVDEGQTSCLLAGVLYMVMIPALFTCSVLSSSYRQKIRLKYNLVEAPSDDCSVHLINPCCALCQEYRELQSKGFDPSLGWMANLALAQQQQETAMYPPGNQYMSR